MPERVDLRFVSPDLRALDALRSEAIVLPFFEDERPLRGPAGLIDWRLCGRLSRLLIKGRVKGTLGEQVLMPGRPRLTFEKLVLAGLGPRAGWSEDVFSQTSRALLEILDGLGARTAVIALPGRGSEIIEPGRAVELFLASANKGIKQDELTLIESHDAQRAMIPALERIRRKVRALQG